jgi:hypothetical protein
MVSINVKSENKSGMSIKLTPKQIKYFWLVGGTIVLLIGLVSMVLPFLPLGYLFTFGGLFILSSRIPALKKFLAKLERKDKKGRVKKINEKAYETEKKIERKLTAGEGDQNTSNTSNKSP